MSNLKRAAAVVIAALLVPIAVAGRAEAAPEKPVLDQCVVHVVGQKPSGELELGPRRCYAEHGEAMRAEGVGHWGAGASSRAAVSLLSFTIGYHCDGFNLVGPCTSVVGDSCIGGWLNVSAAWNNRISSTQNGCPTIRHYDGYGLTGSVQSTFGTGPHNLGALNNQTSSLQYL